MFGPHLINPTKNNIVERLSHQAKCVRLLAEQLENISKNIQMVSTQSHSSSALLAAKRDMVTALKGFDPKYILVTPCEDNNFVFELEPMALVREISNLGFVAESGNYYTR